MTNQPSNSLEEFLVQEPERSEIIQKIYQTTDTWGINIRNMQGIPIHFGLNRFYEVGETEFWIANDEKNNYCGKFLFVFQGQTCPAHCHKKKHETFYIVKGKAKMIMNGEERILEQGEILLMDQGVIHSFTGLIDTLLLEVSNASISGDNFFEDNAIGDKGII